MALTSSQILNQAFDDGDDALKVQAVDTSGTPIGTFWERASGPTSLISSAQDLTGAWADLGAEIATDGYRRIGLWLNVDMNDSVNVRVRMLAKHTTAGAEEYSLPIRTISASDVKIEAEYFELNTDADQQILIAWEIGNIIPFVQFQVMAGNVGASAGQIDTAVITVGY